MIAKWFSTNIRLVCLVESKGAMRYMDSVYLLRATDYEDAFREALQIGRSQEEDYTNSEGECVRWAFKEILSLDMIDVESLDCAEIYSAPSALEPGEWYPFDVRFHPENSDPTHSI